MILFEALQNNLIRKVLGLLVSGLLVTTFSLSGCSKKKESSSSAQTSSQSLSVQAERTVDKALVRNIDLLRSIKGVLKAQVGDLRGKPCVKVFVSKKTAGAGKGYTGLCRGVSGSS